MSESKHTRTPWVEGGSTFRTADTRAYIGGAALVTDVEFIIRAVNNHDALLEALDLLLAWHDEVRRQTPIIPSPFGIETARAALSSARGEAAKP